MPDPSAGEIGGIFAGAVALLVAIGKAFAWLVNLDDRRESTRHAKLDAWQRELDARETRIDRAQVEYQKKIEGQLAALASWNARLQRQQSGLLRAYQTISAALRALDPASPALGAADELIRAAFPVDPDTPAEFLALLADLGLPVA